MHHYRELRTDGLLPVGLGYRFPEDRSVDLEIVAREQNETDQNQRGERSREEGDLRECGFGGRPDRKPEYTGGHSRSGYRDQSLPLREL